MEKTIIRIPTLFRYQIELAPILEKLWIWLERDVEFRARDVNCQLDGRQQLSLIQHRMVEKFVLINTEYDYARHEEMLDAIIETIDHIGTFIKERSLLKATEVMELRGRVAADALCVEAFIFYPDSNENQRPMTRALFVHFGVQDKASVTRIEYHKHLEWNKHAN